MICIDLYLFEIGDIAKNVDDHYALCVQYFNEKLKYKCDLLLVTITITKKLPMTIILNLYVSARMKTVSTSSDIGTLWLVTITIASYLSYVISTYVDQNVKTMKLT